MKNSFYFSMEYLLILSPSFYKVASIHVDNHGVVSRPIYYMYHGVHVAYLPFSAWSI